MREIKFRAWDEQHKRLVQYPFVIDRGGNIFREYIGGGRVEKHCVLMQFTGLHDKNGVEIYENDLVKDANGDVREIVFEDGGFWMKTPNGEHYMSAEGYREVIGNIYENPDLLPDTQPQNNE